jgi:uncharacterized membrane protein
MLLFTIWFSAYVIRLHDAHLTHKADLGQMDLAIWNTAHGRPFQEIKDERVSTRLTDHVEPIFLPVSAVFWLWNDVRALFVLQAAALASGAWPIYLLARKKIAGCGVRNSDWAGVVFATIYLLMPALQAAAVAEFHALPLAAPLIAWALWAIEDRRWIQFSVASVLLMSVQEGMALLAVTLGIYAAAKSLGPGFRRVDAGTADPRSGMAQTAGHTRNAPAVREASSEARSRQPMGLVAGAAVALLGLAWFSVTTFVVIPHYAAQAYGIAQTPYAARFGALGDSFGDALKAMLVRPGAVVQIILQPLRLRYLFGLFVPVAFLALLAPEFLLLSAPLLLANLLSSFPFQYSGELHYSAPLVPFFVIAGAAGLGRWLCRNRSALATWRLPGKTTRPGPSGTTLALLLALGLVGAGAVGWQIAAGYTPIGREFRRLTPGGWPAVTAHERLLARFTAQIPPDAPASATTDLYPHLSHRELLYQFPTLGDATWALVDVAGTTDRHPVDIQAAIRRMLETGWGVVDAADGYVLLAQGRGQHDLPAAFYDFARAPAAEPTYPLDVTYGDALKLIGYDIVDNSKWRRTHFRFYWQVLKPLPGDTTINMQVLTPWGDAVDDSALRPMPALLWYPPAAWQPGETIVTESMPWYLSQAWAPVLTVAAGGQNWAPQVASTAGGGRQPVVTADGRLRLPAWGRQDGRLAPYERPYILAEEVTARFGDDDWKVRLVQWAAPLAAEPGSQLQVSLRWQADSPAPRDYNVFVHLRDESGRTVATGDAPPTWFVPQPTSRWVGDDRGVSTAHAISLPEGLAPGRYDLVVGWYDWQTGARLPLIDGLGNPAGDEFVLGPVTVAQGVGPRPDISCLIAPESCASQE